MVERTQSSQTLSRNELAGYLTDVAAEFERGANDVNLDVGNKTVTLSPPEDVTADVEVVERTSVIRGNRETVTIELTWKH